MSKSISREIRYKIQNLRQRGFSLSEIKAEVDASYGTVYRYAKNIKVNSEYIDSLRRKRGGSNKRMMNKLIEAKSKASNTVVKLSKTEKAIFLSALYWGEGNKSEFSIINSDPKFIKVFIHGIKEVFDISNERIIVSIRIYEDMDKETCLKFWSEITGVSVSKFKNLEILAGKKKGKLKFGMCRVRVSKGGDVLKYTRSLYERISSLILPP